MKKISTLLAGAVVFGATAMAQPAVSSVLNAASYALTGLPNSGIARGSMFVIFGQRLGPTNLSIINSFPLSTALEGTSVRVTVGGTTVDAYMIYTSAGQVAAILPSTTPEGSGTLTVTYNGQTSAPAPLRVVRSSFGIFAVNQAGSGPGIIQNVNSEADRPVNALNRPARPGQVLILWGTGLGPVTADERAGAVPGDLPVNVEVYVGGRLANVTYKGRSGCCAGIDQIVFTIPGGVEGCYVPVVVKIGDIVSNFTTISIGSGNTCTDPSGLSSEDILRAQTAGTFRTGTVVLTRTASRFEIPGISAVDSRMDNGSAGFLRYDLTRLLASQGAGFGGTSLGACTVYSLQGTSAAPVDPIRADVLNAGPVINISGPRGTKQLTRGAEGFYSAQLGGGIAIPGTPAPAPDYLEPGAYVIDNGSGGSDVGAFRVNLTMPQPLTWENMNSVNTIVRSQGQQITWSGGDPSGFTLITGGSIGPNNLIGGFICMERTNARQFTIPSYVLLNLPSSGQLPATLSVAGSTANARFTATGLDVGIVSAQSGSSKTVTYQ